jgi:tetratricopeptide (TPR) repeat protein
MIPVSADDPKQCPQCRKETQHNSKHEPEGSRPLEQTDELIDVVDEPEKARQEPKSIKKQFVALLASRPRTMLACGIAAVAIVITSVGLPVVWMLYDSTRASQILQPHGRSLSADEVFAKASPAVVRVEVRDSQFRLIGQGSGFLVSEDGLIATNHHVVQNAFFAHVIMNDGTKFPVEGVAALDRNADLALLQIKGMQLPVLKVATTDLPQVGARVYAIGNPKGLINSLSDGLISGLRKQDDDVTLIQTTVPISPGSSGGPLLSDDGSVVGVIVSSFQGGQNLNLAVPAARLLRLINSRGELKTLASAGANPLKAGEARKLDEVWAAIKIKDHAKALELLSAIRASQQGSAAYWYSVGYVHIRLGNHKLAIPALQRAIAINHTEVDSHVLLGISFRKLKRYQEAIAAWNSAILLDPKRANFFEMVGNLHLLFGRPESAVGAFRSALTLNPNNTDLYTGLAQAYRLSRQYQESIDAYKSALLSNPKDAILYWGLGEAYRLSGQEQEAIGAYKSALLLNPKGDLAYLGLGIAYDMRDQVQQAISSYESALALNPRLTDARFNLHDAYWKTKELHKAVYYLGLVTGLDPDSESGKLAKERLDQIRMLQRKGFSLEEIHPAFESNK